MATLDRRRDDRRQEGRAHDERGGVDGDRAAGTEHCDQRAGDGRTDEPAEVVGDAHERVGFLQALHGHELRQQATPGGAEEGLGGAVDGEQDHELPDLCAACQQQRRYDGLHSGAYDVGDQHHPLAAQPVRPDAAHQRQGDEGHTLGGQDEA